MHTYRITWRYTDETTKSYQYEMARSPEDALTRFQQGHNEVIMAVDLIGVGNRGWTN